MMQVGPAVLQATQHLLTLQQQARGPRSLLTAMLDRGIVKLLKMLQELVAVHPWCAGSQLSPRAKLAISLTPQADRCSQL